MSVSELPANQVALASAFKIVAKGRPKTRRQHLDDAEVFMEVLRDIGFRVVPFPPSIRAKRAKKKAKFAGLRTSG